MNCVVAIVRESVTVDPRSRLTLLLLKKAVRPLIPDGIMVLMVTVPVNPKLRRVKVEDAEVPAMKLVGVGSEAAIVKSGVTVKVTVVE